MSRLFDLRPPGGGITFLSILCIAAGGIFLYTGGDSWYTTYVCPLFLPIGIGLWLKYEWARWSAFAFYALGSALMILVMMSQDFAWHNLLRLLMSLGFVYCLWDWDVVSKQEEPGQEYDPNWRDRFG